MNTGCLIVGSVSVSAYEPWLVDSVGLVLLVSSTLWLLQSFLPLFCGGSLSPKRRSLREIFSLGPLSA